MPRVKYSGGKAHIAPTYKVAKRRVAPITVSDEDDDAPQTAGPISLSIPHIYTDDFLFSPHRYKAAYGGRGSGKSWAFADALIIQAHTAKKLILCVRELQNSIQDSVMRLLEKRIIDFGLSEYFDIQNTTIISRLTGSEFIFKGLRHHIQEIKSTEGVDICWVEEAQSVSEESWRTLIPTIRKEGSEIWVTWNPLDERDPTQVRFVKNTPPDCKLVKVNWNLNPFFTKTMDDERRHMLAVDPEEYDHVWEGMTRKIGIATIFRNRFTVKEFKTPKTVERIFLGADFGFGDDPSTLVGGWIDEDTNCLYIDREAYGLHIEIDDLPALYDKVEGSRLWTIKADNSRPETISYLSRRGFSIVPAEKWPNSIEDGIAHLKGFNQIFVHETKCPFTAQEFRLYSYKVDKNTEEIIPIVNDKHNHCIDSIRYALDTYIKGRGGIGIWHKLVEDDIAEKMQTNLVADQLGLMPVRY